VKKWALLLLLISTVAVADIGSVTDVTGTAIIKRGGTSVAVSKGTLIEINDRVEAKGGDVNIKFKDNTTVKVTASSALVIDDFVYDPKTQGGKLGLKAAEGTVRYVSGNIAHNNPNAVNIKTPTAAIAVRGTDFVMAVDETGKSAIILMPTCETEHNVNLKGLTCGSGKIDVETGAGIVHMDKPYQATLVETGNMPPLPPIVVDLGGAPIGNNLMLSPLRTLGGVTIQQAARSAAEKTGDAKKSNNVEKKDDVKQTSNDNTPSTAEANTTQQQSKQQDKAKSDQEAADAQAAKAVVDIANLEKQIGKAVSNTPYQDLNVFEIHKHGNPTLQQIGWGYDSLSPNGHNYANISMPMDTKIVIIMTQDRITDAYNFNGQNTKAQGSITVTQTYR
jgi:hypothetical protein